ncbi:hypothetical protein RhiirC2_720129 [Rhizophagus irregularis]|uniref:Uncharacterized protein n=1 Tax=Rhizophagus irregularis TaxID=588596 RepID=A0A2N1MBH6_9GLOM|nr:hypothetical protein RhiirC2_720129 [Rhizophagus irregularis]
MATKRASKWKNKPPPCLATKQSQTSENRWVAIKHQKGHRHVKIRNSSEKSAPNWILNPIGIDSKLTIVRSDRSQDPQKSRRFRTDETSQKESQVASKLTKRLRRNNPRLRYEFWIGTTCSFGFGSVTVTVNFEKHYQLLVLIFRIGSITVLLSSILDLDLD